MAGPFYFAWIAASEMMFDPITHAREDEDVFGFTVEHSEGDFAGLDIEIRNPRVGLLAPARKVHAFLAYNTGAEIKPLFRGRLVGIPDDINQEIVRLQFTARPDDYAAQKSALAASGNSIPTNTASKSVNSGITACDATGAATPPRPPSAISASGSKAA